MSLDKMIPAAPKSNLIGWLTLISVLLIIILAYDTYFGRGDFFGLSKKQKFLTGEPKRKLVLAEQQVVNSASRQ